MNTYSSLRWLAGLVAGAFVVTPGLPLVADVFVLDTNQSSITISGTVAGYSFAAQGAGSLTAAYGGTIQAAQTANTIQFTGQSLIQAQNSGSWQPKSDGSAGSEPANYGAQANAVFATAKAALRNLQLDVTSSALAVTGGQFDSRSLVFAFPTNAPSSMAYSVTGLLNKSGALPLTGYATNAVTSVATLTVAGGQQTLTIPVNATFVVSLVTANDTTIIVNGQLVAVRSAAAPLVVQSISVQSQVVTLQWQAAAGQQFQVRSSSDLATWQTNAVNVTSATATYTWSGPATARRQFFRLAK